MGRSVSLLLEISALVPSKALVKSQIPKCPSFGVRYRCVRFPCSANHGLKCSLLRLQGELLCSLTLWLWVGSTDAFPGTETQGKKASLCYQSVAKQAGGGRREWELQGGVSTAEFSTVRGALLLARLWAGLSLAQGFAPCMGSVSQPQLSHCPSSATAPHSHQGHRAAVRLCSV